MMFHLGIASEVLLLEHSFSFTSQNCTICELKLLFPAMTQIVFLGVFGMTLLHSRTALL
jgi:hypothetical protein